MPGIARIGPIDTTGLDGATITTSAEAMASSTPGAGVDAATPRYSNERAAMDARCRVHHSWKCMVPPSVTTWVSTSSSVAGIRRTPSGQREVMRAVASLRGSPSRNRWVRVRWVPMSRSPRVNHGHPTPYARSSALTRSLSPTLPQPRSSSFSPASVYMIESRSGAMRNPVSHMSSPTFTIAVTSSLGVTAERSPRRNRAPPTPPERTVIFIRPTLRGGWELTALNELSSPFLADQ